MKKASLLYEPGLRNWFRSNATFAFSPSSRAPGWQGRLSKEDLNTPFPPVRAMDFEERLVSAEAVFHAGNVKNVGLRQMPKVPNRSAGKTLDDRDEPSLSNAAAGPEGRHIVSGTMGGLKQVYTR